MNEDQAIDAALVAFVGYADDASLREKLAAALAAYVRTLRTCSACRGSRKVVKRGGVLLVAEGYGRTGQPIEDGSELPCVACGGYGVDLTQVVWTCRHERGHQCRPDHEPDNEHEDCGWALNPQPPSSAEG